MFLEKVTFRKFLRKNDVFDKKKSNFRQKNFQNFGIKVIFAGKQHF